MRWVLVLVLVASLGAALLTVKEYRTAVVASDEIRAHEVTAERWTEFLIPGGVEELVLSSWCVVPPRAEYDPAHNYAYRIRAAVTDVNGEPVSSPLLEVSSRISGDPRTPVSEGMFAARLLDSNQWVSDARSHGIDTGLLKAAPGRLKLRAEGGRCSRVLVRAEHPQARSRLERLVAEHSLTPNERKRFVAQRSALGFGDLPEATRHVALASWNRRLTAVGREGVDYVTRPLLLGSHRLFVRDAAEERPALRISPTHAALLNFRGPLTLRVNVGQGSTLAVTEGQAQPFEVLVGSSGQVDLALSQQGPRTVAVRSNRSDEVQFTVNEKDAHKQLGDVLQLVRGSRVELQPDVRIQYYLRLSPRVPIVYSLAPGQSMLGLSIRALGDGRAMVQNLHMEWVGSHSSQVSAPIDISQEEQGFDMLEGTPVTDPLVTLVRPPPGALALRIRGPDDLLMAAWTREPGVNEAVIVPAYRIQLEAHQVWRNAPHTLRPVAPLRADNHSELVSEGRLARVMTQVRIDEIEPGRGRRIAERVLTPLGRSRSRHLFVRAYHSKGAPFSEHGWTQLTERDQKVLVSEHGSNARRLNITYRVDPERLGSVLGLLQDGREVERTRLGFSTGSWRVPSDPGVYHIRLAGISETDLAFVQAAPADGGVFFKQQRLYEIGLRSGISFRFQRRPGELLSLFIFVAADGQARDFQLRYEIDPSREHSGAGRFSRRLTTFSGVLSGRTGQFNQGLFWETDGRRELDTGFDGVERLRLPLGDDLPSGWHELRLTLQEGAAGPVWTRATLAGRMLEPDQEASL